MNNQKLNVVVLGASNKPDRVSNKAVRFLKRHGYTVIPIHPRLTAIEGFSVLSSLNEIQEDIHTLTIYVSPNRIGPMIDSIIKLNPERVVMNPGTESHELIDRLKENNIPYLAHCTLKLLNSGQF